MRFFAPYCGLHEIRVPWEKNYGWRRTYMKAIQRMFRTLASKRRSRLTAAQPALLAVCSLLLLLTGCEWPMYRQGPGRTGQSGVNTSSNAGKLQWSYSNGLGQNQVPYGPVIGATSSTGGIYLGDEFGTVYSVTTSGKLAWSTPTGGIGATPSAVGMDLSVYAMQIGGSLYDVTSTGVNWTFSPPNGLSPANLATANDGSGTIYTGNQCGVFYALNPNGTTKWAYSGFAKDCDTGNAGAPTISPAVGPDGTIYSGVNYGFNAGGVLFALSPSGSLLWSSKTYAGTPAVSDNGTIYVLGLGGGQLYALNSSGTLQWQVNAPNGGEFTLPAIASDGSIYVGTAGEGLMRISAAGAVIWNTTPAGISYFFSPATIGGDGTVYIVGDANNGAATLLAVNPSSTVKWSNSNLCDSASGVFDADDEPVIGFDGTIYLILDGFAGDVASCPLQAFH
jgi:hypothetical protein